MRRTNTIRRADRASMYPKQDQPVDQRCRRVQQLLKASEQERPSGLQISADEKGNANKAKGNPKPENLIVSITVELSSIRTRKHGATFSYSRKVGGTFPGVISIATNRKNRRASVEGLSNSRSRTTEPPCGLNGSSFRLVRPLRLPR